MKRITLLLLVALLLISTSSCNKSTDSTTTPHIKGIKWYDSIETVKEIEKKSDKVIYTKDGYTILKCLSQKLPFGDFKSNVEYSFEDNKLTFISIMSLGPISEKQLKQVTDWANIYYNQIESNSEETTYYRDKENESSVMGITETPLALIIRFSIID